MAKAPGRTKTKGVREPDPKRPRVAVVIEDIVFPPSDIITPRILQCFNEGGYDIRVTVSRGESWRQKPIPLKCLKASLICVLRRAEKEAIACKGVDWYCTVFKIPVYATEHRKNVPSENEHSDLFFTWLREQDSGMEWTEMIFSSTTDEILDEVTNTVGVVLHQRPGYTRAYDPTEGSTVTQILEFVEESYRSTELAIPEVSLTKH